MKRIKSIVLVTLLVVILGTSLILAAEPVTQAVPWRIRVMEILQKNPEILEELQALENEFQKEWEQASEDTQSFPFFGMMGMMRGMGRRGYAPCHNIISQQPQNYGPGHRMMAPGWFR